MKQIPANSSNSGIEQGKLLSRKSFPVSRGESRTNVVESEPIFAKYEAPKNLNARNYNSTISIGLGRGDRDNLSANHSKGALVSARKIKRHKCIGVELINFGRICKLDIHLREINKSHTLANRQCYSTDLPCENEGYPQQGTFKHSQGNLELFDTQSDHNYSQNIYQVL